MGNREFKAALATTLLLGFPASPRITAAGAKHTFDGLIESITASSLSLRLDNGIIIEARLAPNLASSVLAAGHRIGDKVSLDCVEIAPVRDASQQPQSLDVLALHEHGIASADDRRHATASRSWRTEGNLLPSPDAPPVPAGILPNDANFAKIQANVLAYVAAMPNYVADESSTRWVAPLLLLGEPPWKPLDNLQSEVSYDDGNEIHQKIVRNGQPWPRDYDELPGLKWFGGFAGRLARIFSPGCATSFTLDSSAAESGAPVLVYRFQQPPDACVGAIRYGFRLFYPGASGRVWVDAADFNVRRLEEKMVGIPRQFPETAMRDSVTWTRVTTEGVTRLLPADSEMVATLAEGQLFRIATHYANYRRFSVTSKVLMHP